MRDLRTLVRVLWCEVTALALVLTGDVSFPISIAVLVLIPFVGLSRPDAPWRRRARSVSSFTTVAYLAFFPIDVLFVSGRLIFAIVHLTFYLKLHTLLHQESPRERSRLHLICLFEMLAAASMTVDAAFVVPLSLFVLVGAVVMLLEQARPRPAESDMLRAALRTALVVVVPTAMVAAVLFVTLPRASYGGFRLGGITGITVTGFSESVRLGDFETIRRDTDVVMRIISREPGTRPPRWRGPAYDRYEDGSWRQTLSGVFSLPQPGRGRFLLDRPQDEPLAEHEVFVEPLDTDVVFLPPASESISTSERYLFVDPYLTLRTGRRARAGRRYAVSWRHRAQPGTSPVGGVERLSEQRQELYTQLPPLSPRFHALAAAVVDGADTESAARSVERYLESSFAYTLTPPERVHPDPLEDFLFEAKAGHCEYFATAMVLLLRARDFPARLVTGFNRGEDNSVGEFEVIRKTNAHAWVEVFDRERGWVAFDPTPASLDALQLQRVSLLSQSIDSLRMLWDMYVVAFDVERQRGLISLVGGLGRSAAEALARSSGRLVRLALFGLLALALAVAVVILWRSRFLARLRVRLAAPETAASPVLFYERLLVLLARLGVEKPEGQTPLEFARSREGELPGLIELTRVYYRVRFGGESLSPEESKRVERLAAAIRLAAVSDVGSEA